jgi:hypothetical protein
VVTGFGDGADLTHGLKMARRDAGSFPQVRWRRVVRIRRTVVLHPVLRQKRAAVPDNRKPQL